MSNLEKIHINSSTKISSPLDLFSYFQNDLINRNGSWQQRLNRGSNPTAVLMLE